jgi:hypothetical protein
VGDETPVWLSRFEVAPGKLVYVPDAATKEFGRQLKQDVEKLWQPPAYFEHLGTRGHVRALQDHLDSRYFARVDLKSFFGSIYRNRITRNLHELLHDYKRARAAAVMSTVPVRVGEALRHVLPFGFVQSPLIATLCLATSKLGRTLKELNGVVELTVYVDDILISSDSQALLTEAYESLLSAAVASKFVVHAEKSSPPAERTTVFNIDLETHHLKISDPRLARFQAKLVEAGEEVVGGILGYVRSVNSEQAEQLEAALG